MKRIQKRRRRFFFLLTAAAILVLIAAVTVNNNEHTTVHGEPYSSDSFGGIILVTPSPEAPDLSMSPLPSSTNTPAADLPDLCEPIVETEVQEIEPESVEEEPIEIKGLIELLKLDNSFVMDLRYATENNFTGKVIYKDDKCLIHKDTAQKLIAANNEFKSLGYSIKIFDAYRPHSAQKILWNAASDKSYVASPKNGSIHNRGAAVDITLVDAEGKELPMPSGYDEFTERAHLDYSDCPKEQIDNRELLGRIMKKHGFRRISHEWWHFEDTNAKSYPILDIQFEEF